MDIPRPSQAGPRRIRPLHGLSQWVDDRGPGIANSANLSVPFFTTKPHGSG